MCRVARMRSAVKIFENKDYSKTYLVIVTKRLLLLSAEFVIKQMKPLNQISARFNKSLLRKYRY